MLGIPEQTWSKEKEDRSIVFPLIALDAQYLYNYRTIY